MQKKNLQKIAAVLIPCFLLGKTVYGQDLDLEQYAKSEGILFWVWVVVVSLIVLVLFASLLFSKKKEYTK